MSYRTLLAQEAFWRPSNQMGVLNTDLAKQLEATTLGARLWRLQPGQASTRHRHRQTHELYVLLEGTGRIRIGQDLHTLEPLCSLLVRPRRGPAAIQRHRRRSALARRRRAARGREHARDDPRTARVALPGRTQGAPTRDSGHAAHRQRIASNAGVAAPAPRSCSLSHTCNRVIIGIKRNGAARRRGRRVAPNWKSRCLPERAPEPARRHERDHRRRVGPARWRRTCSPRVAGGSMRAVGCPRWRESRAIEENSHLSRAYRVVAAERWSCSRPGRARCAMRSRVARLIGAAQVARLCHRTEPRG